MRIAGENHERGKRGLRIALVVVSVFALLNFASTFYQEGSKLAAVRAMNESKLNAERLLGEKLQLEKGIVELDARLGSGTEALMASEQSVAALRRQLDAAYLNKTRALEAAARKSNKLMRDVAEMKGVMQQKEARLAAARSSEGNVQEQLQRTTEERDALVAQLDTYKEGARMVNNAAVEALRGNKLTVVARRTKEIRMAFDLPEDLAKGAGFRIITPDGRDYKGGDPAVSIAFDNAPDEAVASLITVPMAPKERAARVHLKFIPETKLEAGTYRIDVLSGNAYLNTILLNLR